MMHLTILGGGPAGLAVAHYAHRAGLPLVLFERQTELGGLCRTEQCGPHRYDTGAHRFHDRDSEITADVREVLGGDLVPVDAPSRILLSGRLVAFPPTPVGLARSCAPGEIGRIGLDLMRSRRARRIPANFAEFACESFGRTLARRFLLGYSEKVWGLPAEQLSVDVATRRLSGMTLRTLLVELLLPARKSAHIDGRFLYPRGGYGRLTEALARSVPSSSLATGHEITGMDCAGERIVRLRFRGCPDFEPPDRVVSTLPLTRLAAFLEHALPGEALEAARGLRFRHVRLVFLRLARARVSRNASIYLADAGLCVSRVYEPKNRCRTMAPEDETAIVAEVPCFAGDAIHGEPDEALARRVAAELEQAGLLGQGDVIEWRHHLLPNAYPVYTLDYAKNVRVVLDALDRIRNLNVAGRNGLFFYSHLHDQLRGAKDLVAGWRTMPQGLACTEAAGARAERV
jgi:protoporphyrinogen oxidase